MMADLIRSAVNRLKKVSIGVWFVCALVVLVGGWLIAVITKPPSAVQLQRRAAHEYSERCNNYAGDNNTLEYDGFKFGLVKRDCRYFLIPRKYWSAFGFSFFWPKELESFYRSTVSSDENFNKKRDLASISVFMKSQKEPYYQELPILDHHGCATSTGTSFKWNGIIIGIVVEDHSLFKERPQICQEALNILDQIKEIKNQ